MITNNLSFLSEYTNILQTKIVKPPLLDLGFNFNDLGKTISVRIREKLRAELQLKYQLLDKETHQRFEKMRLQVQISELERIIKQYDKKIGSWQEPTSKKINKYSSSLVVTYQIQLEIVSKIREKISSIKEEIIPLIPEKLNWKLLPKGEMTFHQLRQYLEQFSNGLDEEYDYEKIEKILTLKPDKIYCGIDEFDGYLVFYLHDLETAILDCPKKGNAIYIFGEDWKNLSSLSKSELLNYYPEKTQRIIHRGEWFKKLKSNLLFRRKS